MLFGKGRLGADGLAITAMVHDLSMLGLSVLMIGHVYFTFLYDALSAMRTGHPGFAVAAGARCLERSQYHPMDVRVLVNCGVQRDGHVCEPAVAAYVQHGLGINVDAQPNIEIDSAIRPHKKPRAYCVPILVPDEIKPRIQDVIEHLFNIGKDQSVLFRVMRTEMYCKDNNRWVSPMSF